MDLDVNAFIRSQQAQQHNPDREESALRDLVFGPAPKLLARFYIGSRKDSDASEREGVPVYIEQLHVLVQVPGDKDSVTQIVTEDHVEKYPREWEIFKRLSIKPEIPLTALPLMRPNIKAALEELGIRNVDQLIAYEKDLGYLAKWKPWALQIKGVHDIAEGKPKPRLKLVDGQMVAA